MKRHEQSVTKTDFTTVILILCFGFIKHFPILNGKTKQYSLVIEVIVVLKFNNNLYMTTAHSLRLIFHFYYIFFSMTYIKLYKIFMFMIRFMIFPLQKIRDDDDFDFIISIIPNMMVGLRHIWTMSNYYCRDENMLSLLAKISNVFNTKIKGIANLETIFKWEEIKSFFFVYDICWTLLIKFYRANSKKVLKISNYCAELLDRWKQCYIDTRAHIENSGVGSRWEFDKTKIFGELDHIARICRDVAKIASTFILYETVFNNNLRSIVTHPEEVDSMLKKVI